MSLYYSTKSHWASGRLLICAFLSGAAGLTYEVLRNRQLLLVFGSITYATAGLLAAFMGGLAIGAALVARWGARIRSPLKLYAVVEGSVALYAIAFSKLLSLTNALGKSGQGVFSFDFHAIPVPIGGVFLLLPTVALGAGAASPGLHL